MDLKFIEFLTKEAGEVLWLAPDESIVDASCASFEDAYYGGVNDGRRALAREIIENFSGNLLPTKSQ